MQFRPAADSGQYTFLTDFILPCWLENKHHHHKKQWDFFPYTQVNNILCKSDRAIKILWYTIRFYCSVFAHPIHTPTPNWPFPIDCFFKIAIPTHMHTQSISKTLSDAPISAVFHSQSDTGTGDSNNNFHYLTITLTVTMIFIIWLSDTDNNHDFHYLTIRHRQ